MSWYLKVLKQYADFTGRARRKEYWMFVLFNLAALFVVVFLDNLLGLTFTRDLPYGTLFYTYMFALAVPGLAVTVRRLHDTGRSGWWFLINFLPFVGFIWLLVLILTPGTPGVNRYGVNPKEVEGNPQKDKTKNAAAALIIAASAGLLALPFIILVLIKTDFYIRMDTASIIQNSLWQLIPAALLVLGISLLQSKNGRSKFAALTLVMLFGILTIFRVIALINFNFAHLNINIITVANLLMIVFFIALLMLGVYLLQKEDKPIIKPRVMAVLLWIASLIMVLATICNISIIRMSSYTDIIWFFSNITDILIACSLVVLASALLQNKSDIAKEDERVITCREEVQAVQVQTGPRIRLGFAIVNICMGVIIFMSSIMMFYDKDIGGYGIIPLFIGLFLWISGAYALYVRKNKADNISQLKSMKVVTLIAFILSCVILLFIILTPVMIEIFD